MGRDHRAEMAAGRNRTETSPDEGGCRAVPLAGRAEGDRSRRVEMVADLRETDPGEGRAWGDRKPEKAADFLVDRAAAVPQNRCFVRSGK